MNKRTIVKNGKKYIVNTPDWNDDVGNEEGIGSGDPLGTFWMQSTDTNWYSVLISGSAPSATTYVNQSTIGYADKSYGYQQLLCNDGNSYLVYLTGTSPSVTLQVSQSAFTGSGLPKPDLLLQSITDGNYYMVTLKNTAGTISINVNQTYITGSWLSHLGY